MGRGLGWEGSGVGEGGEHALVGILGLLCAERSVGNLIKWTYRNAGTTVRRTKRRKSPKMNFQEFWDSCAQNNTSEISIMDFQEFWDSCAQNKTSEISTNGLSGILGLLCAEQDFGNVKKCIVIIYGTSVRRKERRKPQKTHFQEFEDACAQNKTNKNHFQKILDSCTLNATANISKSALS